MLARRLLYIPLALAAAATLVAQPADLRPPVPPPGPQHLDARVVLARGAQAAPLAAQQAALDDLRAAMPDLRAEIDEATGATRTLWNVGGYLTMPDRRDAQVIAEDFMRSRTALLGLVASDVVDYELTDRVPSAASGVTHLYFRQRVNGVPVYNAQLHVNLTRDGRILSVNSLFLPNVTAAVASLAPRLDAVGAVGRAAQQLGLRDVPALVTSADGSPRRATRLQAPDLSTEEIVAELVIVPVRQGLARLAWNFQVWTPDQHHAYDYTVDAESGQVWTRFDWVAGDQYRVYPLPVESPSHATPAPPADGRALVVNPAHPVASPFGWHDTNGVPGAEFTSTQGNNVHAYVDADNDNVPDAGSSPGCGAALECDFGLDLAGAPTAYQPAAVTNLFYWNNVVHDVQHRYGFTEAAGNFQTNNYGQAGLAGDSVRAEAQDSAGKAPDLSNRNNANFATPPDGQRPRMQMYLWNLTTPDHDGDLDAGILVHEYGHGISNRLVGGPSNVSCLTNAQQPGEGISDWLALVYTAKGTDTATMGRGIGTYVMGQPPTGQGIRAQRYSTNPAVNTWTYASVSGAAIPHGVGAVWAQGMWEAYWALVTAHGWSSDLYDATGGAGNQRAMLYHNEGLMNTACSPSFTQVRDGIIQAAQTLHGGADVCRLWSAFAAFGLGVDAQSGGPSSTTPLNGFSTPASCGGTPPPGVSVGDASVVEGNTGVANANFTVSLNTPSANPVTVTYRTANGSAVSGITSGSFSNTFALSIPDAGPASFYPSTITVPAGAGAVQALAVTMNGFGHTSPADVDVLLVGPGGQRVVLMSDAGGPPVSGVGLTFRDDADGAVPAGVVTSGAYLPTNHGQDDVFIGAPPDPYGSALGEFIGSPASGIWSLYIVDDQPGGAGVLTGGWTLHLGTSGNDFAPRQGTITFLPGSTTQAVSVPVLGDVQVESTEAFTLRLSSAGGAYIADDVGLATIVDDDTVGAAQPPTGLFISSVVGNTVTLGWTPPSGGSPPTGYVLEGGIDPGEVGASIPTGSAVPTFTFVAPSGAFYIRLHTLSGASRSAPSNEIRLFVNVPVSPSPPASFLGVVDGSSLALAWKNTFDGGAPTGLVLDVAGAIETTIPLGMTDTFSFVGVPPGTYALGLRAVNGAGSSPASEPLTLTFPGECSGPPAAATNVRAYRVGHTVYVAWDPPLAGPAPVSYVLNVTGGLAGSFGTTARAMSGVVQPGTYDLTVVAANPCGPGPATSPQTVVVP
jgi:extracellular elastinolytic metalloproteinase